ncbi:MAG: hypothetical protein ACXWMO_13070, partial [Syntrophales bacterium]
PVRAEQDPDQGEGDPKVFRLDRQVSIEEGVPQDAKPYGNPNDEYQAFGFAGWSGIIGHVAE